MMSVLKAEAGWFVETRDAVSGAKSQLPVEFWCFVLEPKTGKFGVMVVAFEHGELKLVTGKLTRADA